MVCRWNTNWTGWIGPLADLKASPQVTEREHTGAKEQGIDLKGQGKKPESKYKSPGGKLWVSDNNDGLLTRLPAFSLCFGVLLSRGKHLYSQDNTCKVVPPNGEHCCVFFPYSFGFCPFDILFYNLKFKEILNVLAGTFL